MRGSKAATSIANMSKQNIMTTRLEDGQALSKSIGREGEVDLNKHFDPLKSNMIGISTILHPDKSRIGPNSQSVELQSVRT